MEQKFITLKNFVHRHRVAFAVIGTTTAFLFLMRANAKQLNEFLEKHNLLEEYYREED